jgi:hypothetical protein
MDNLNLSVGAAGYYYKKKVFIFTENQPYALNDFDAFFKGAKDFPFFDLFVSDAEIISSYKNRAIKKPVFDELMAFHLWLNNGDGKSFVNEIKTISKPPFNVTYAGWIESLDISILLHEAIGHGGTYYNKTMKESALPTFENPVDAEFYAYLLEFIYSHVQGFNLACMFSDMADPSSFTDRYGDAYLKICNELLVSIEKNRDLSDRFNNRAKTGDKITISSLADNFRKYEKLNCKARIKGCLLPLISFFNELNQEERTDLFRSVYFRNTDKPIPEPVRK